MTNVAAIISSRDTQSFRDGLPQGQVLSEQSILNWMERMEKSNDFHGAGWHYRRLTGIGGSEAGHAVQQSIVMDGGAPERIRGRWGRHLVMEKLLELRPDDPTAAMLRGNHFEELIIQRFLQQTGAVIRQDLMDAVAEASGEIGEHPWLVGQPDLIVEMPNGDILLVDIKAPSEPSEKAQPEYVAQLHHYRCLMAEARVPPNGMVLGNFNWRDYAINQIDVPYDRRIDDRLRRGGDNLWQRILDGNIPDASEVSWPKPAWDLLKPEDQDLLRQSIADNEESFLFAKMVSDRAKKRADEAADLIREDIRRLGPARKRKGEDYGLSMVGLTTRMAIDAEKFRETIDAFGLNRQAERAYVAGKDWDGDAMAKRLEELGEDPNQFKKRTINQDVAIEVLEEMGVSYDVAMDQGVIVENPIPTFRKPTKGKRFEVYQDFSEIVGAIDTRIGSDIDAAINNETDHLFPPEPVDENAVEEDEDAEKPAPALMTANPAPQAKTPKPGDNPAAEAASGGIGLFSARKKGTIKDENLSDYFQSADDEAQKPVEPKENEKWSVFDGGTPVSKESGGGAISHSLSEAGEIESDDETEQLMDREAQEKVTHDPSQPSSKPGKAGHSALAGLY